MMRVKVGWRWQGSLLLGVACLAAVQAQAAEGARRGPGMGGRDSLMGLLAMEQVQKELKLTAEQSAKVQEVVEKLRAEMREQLASLGESQDRQQRRAAMAKVRDQFDAKLREQLGDTVPREQMRRLYGIRLQVRAVADSLASERLAERLKLTDEQRAKVAQIAKDMEGKQSEVYSSMGDLNEDQRREAREKLLKIRSDADEKALGVLTSEQKAAFEEMKGAKIELPMQRGPRPGN